MTRRSLGFLKLRLCLLQAVAAMSHPLNGGPSSAMHTLSRSAVAPAARPACGAGSFTLRPAEPKAPPAPPAPPPPPPPAEKPVVKDQRLEVRDVKLALPVRKMEERQTSDGPLAQAYFHGLEAQWVGMLIWPWVKTLGSFGGILVNHYFGSR